jgi:23S rRNA (guanine2445-N2)-methyltransferase / 23S rRNA (guanine2069-N7)-methyltransferase
MQKLFLDTEIECFAPCAAGLSGVLADELRGLGAARVRKLPSGVAFFCGEEDGGVRPLEAAYRALLWSRVASRVLLILARGEATDADSLYALVREIPWELHVADGARVAISVDGVTDALRDTRFSALRVKDAMSDRLRATSDGAAISLTREDADVYVAVSLKGRRARVALDLAGEPLHKRGYRVPSPAIEAPVRETLAAAMVLAAGWDASSTGDTFVGTDAHIRPQTGNDERTKETVLLDPLCGSGTIAIEAALIAGDRAPGLLRSVWGHRGWLGHDAELWDDLLAEADDRAEAGSARLAQVQDELGCRLVAASDIDPRAVEVAAASAKRAGVAEFIAFETRDIGECVQTWNNSGEASEQAPKTHPTLVVTNPPYGQRIASRSQLPALYAALQQLAAQAGTGESDRARSDVSVSPASSALCLITTDPDIDRFLGATPTEVINTFNGPTEATIRLYTAVGTDAHIRPHGGSNQRTGQVTHPYEGQIAKTFQGDASQGDVSLDTQIPAQHAQFAARLTKMAKHRAKWARRAGIGCYRVYDADLPDYQVAIDLYTGAPATRDEGQRWAVIAEYAAPREIAPEKAAERTRAVLALAPHILGIPTDAIFFKQRRRDKGGSQYSGERVQTGKTAPIVAAPHSQHFVAEDGLTFVVDFSGYIDTGLFLDHRMVRSLLRAQSADRRCLNLFAYTGAASVFMAAGGAQTVHTVDLSQTYLDRAHDNMARNGFGSKTAYTFEQADVLGWAADHRHDKEKYDLIFVDPPTFSNSKRMRAQSWDVQRNHAELLIALSRMLAHDGQIVFSTNLTSFKPDTETLTRARVELKDITPQTIPPDFDRKGKPIHRCYLARRT